MPKPTPKKGSAPTAQPAHTRAAAPEHPWDPPTAQPAPAQEQEEDAPSRARTRVRAPVSKREDRGPAIDTQQWRRLVTTEGQRLRAAQRKASARAADLDAVLSQARTAGVDDAQISAWLTDAGLDPADIS